MPNPPPWNTDTLVAQLDQIKHDILAAEANGRRLEAAKLPAAGYVAASTTSTGHLVINNGLSWTSEAEANRGVDALNEDRPKHGPLARVGTTPWTVYALVEVPRG